MDPEHSRPRSAAGVADGVTVPLVTVVVTAYNREQYIAAAIESVLAQTFADFELLIVDDASIDATAEIADGYARRDRRVRLVVNERNRGQFPNRNHAAGLVATPLFKFHDSDDVMYAHCLQVMVAALESEPHADFALSGSRSWPGGPSPMLLTPRLAYQREFLGSGMFQLGPACGLFRSEFFRSIGGFPVAGTASDYVFWAKACSTGNVLLVAADLFYYRVHPGQELASERTLLDTAAARRQVWRMLNSADCPLRGDELEQAKRNFMFTVLREAWYQLRDGRPRSAAAYLAHTSFGVNAWLRYLRMPRRSTMAGTPVWSA